MGLGRGAHTFKGSGLLLWIVLIALFPTGGTAQDTDTLSLQLVAGQRQPHEELHVETLHVGTSSKKLRDEALQLLPLAKLTAPSQKLAQGVIHNASLYRRLPTIRCQADHHVYRFFADHPDVAVGMWRAMGVSKLQMFQTGEFEYEADAKDGTVGVITILSRTPTDCLIHCSGMFQSPVLAKPIQARAILHVRTAFEVNADDQQLVTHTGDLFVTFPSQTVENVAKAMAPISNKITDKNFEEISLFVRMMQLAMTQQPGWVEQMAAKLDGVIAGRSDQLLQVTAQCYIDEKKRLGEIIGEPARLESIRPPVAIAPQSSVPR